MVEIFYSPKFLRMYRKLPQEIKILMEEKEAILRENPYDTRLKTHRLNGELKEYFAFSIDHKHRVIFSLVSEGTIRLHAVGAHKIYSRVV